VRLRFALSIWNELFNAAGFCLRHFNSYISQAFIHNEGYEYIENV